MDLRKIFKKKKPSKIEKPKEEPLSETKPEIKKVKKERLGIRAYRILKVPHITEKATDLAEKNQYVFEVYPRANKTEIKRAIEDLYDVDVLNVRTVKIFSKKRRKGKVLGWKKGYKKAIVKIKEGQKIEVLPH